MKITLDRFIGMQPRLHPEILPPLAGTEATATRMERGILEPMKAAYDTGDSVTIGHEGFFRFDGTLYSFTSPDVDMARAPVDTNRLYWTGDGVPKMHLVDTATTYDLALDAPASAPVAAILSGTPAEYDQALVETVLYVMTFVSSLGEESAPSPVSNAIDWHPGEVVRLTNLNADPLPRLVTNKRIYRSQTSEEGETNLYLVAEVVAATSVFDHNLTAFPLLEVIPVEHFDTPPDDMAGLTVMPNGLMAAFSGKELLFCEPYQPHAWPSRYRLSVADDIVGLCSFGTSLAVLTTGRPYVVQGTEPDSLVMERSQQNYPCVSKNSIVDLGYACLYASYDGLVAISESEGARMLSEPLYTADQWRALDPASFRAAMHNNRYVASYDTGGPGGRNLLFLDFRGQQPFALTHEIAFDNLYFDYETSELLGVRKASGDVFQIERATGDDVGFFTWTSKVFRLPAPSTFGAIRVDGNALTTPPVLNITVFSEGATVRTIASAIFGRVYRLPAVLGQTWQIRIQSNNEVTRIVMAGSPEEMAND